MSPPQAREFDAKKVERLRREHRHYTPDLLGADCPLCKTPMVAALVAAGASIHPCCDPADRPLFARLEETRP